MPNFICDSCGCIENTALCGFWARNMEGLPDEYRGKALCSECESTTFKDGSKNGTGKWHGKFKKQHWSEVYTTKPDKRYF